jgi:hypothetical protein
MALEQCERATMIEEKRLAKPLRELLRLEGMDIAQAIKLMSRPGKFLTRKVWLYHTTDMQFFESVEFGFDGSTGYWSHCDTPGRHWGRSGGGPGAFDEKSVQCQIVPDTRKENVEATDYIELTKEQTEMWKAHLVETYPFKNSPGPTGPQG